jgi:outer membrane protein assembly factor BamB
VRRAILLTISLTLAALQPVSAGTFERSPIVPEMGLDALTRGVTRDKLGRDLFSDPYATVTIGHVDVYNVFPYVESRTFQVVSDPRWNRLVYGESGRTLRAYDGIGRPFGPLSDPRGLSVDEEGRIYVADAGNDRILVLQSSNEHGDLDLSPLFEIDGLSQPYSVAYSDGGTPFVHGDDRLYVADTGRNRVVAFALETASARTIAQIGELGSGPGHFAGPMAITVGRLNGANTNDVYVADAHTRRLVHLRQKTGAFEWVADAQHDSDVLTSLDADQWGNLYAASPHQGVVRKFAPDLTPVAELRQSLSSPRGFHVPFYTVRDHRVGSTQRVGRPNGLAVDQWTDATGVTLWNFGIEVSALAVNSSDSPGASFRLTDQAAVSYELADASSGRVLAHRGVGTLAAGSHTISIAAPDIQAAAAANDVVLRVSAASSYANGPVATAQASFRSGGGVAPARAMLLGNAPNPVSPTTWISFLLPNGATDHVALRVFDARGRLVRTFDHAFSPGLNEVLWDGTDNRGSRVGAGVYFYRLDVSEQRFNGKMVVVR